MRCDLLPDRCKQLFLVSIPAGFSDALRLGYGGRITRRIPIVSIPAGFSDALRLTISALPAPPTISFQSLLGFLMRCDTQMELHKCMKFLGFNPCWVF